MDTSCTNTTASVKDKTVDPGRILGSEVDLNVGHSTLSSKNQVEIMEASMSP